MSASSDLTPDETLAEFRAAGAMQIPVYSTLTDAQAARVARVVRSVLASA